MANHYFFEIYTKGPNGENGWDIQVGFVLNAGNRQTAVNRLKVKLGKKFDCIIQCHESLLFPIDGPKTILHT